MNVKKRDGRIELFKEEKIKNAIQKSFNSTNITIEKEKLDELVKEVVSLCPNNPKIEEIQDNIENQLMIFYPDVAKKYIKYRENRRKARNSEEVIKKTIDGIIEIKESDISQENANMSAQTPAGQMMSIASITNQDYALNYLVKEKYGALHQEGYIHIHDLDYYPNKTTTCVQYDLAELFKKGFKTKNGSIREPQSIASYATLATIIFQTNQNEQHGGQSIPAFDFYMAPGITKSFKKNLIKVIEEYFFMNDEFINVTELINKNVESIEIINDQEIEKSLNINFKKFFQIALNNTEKETFQAMEGFIHNLNTMHSRGGNQVVFSSINYGTDTSYEGRMVIRNILKATQKGLGTNEVPVFPIQIFKVKEGVNYSKKDLEKSYNSYDWNDEFLETKFYNPNFDLFLRAVKTSSTSLFPNFVFLDTPYNKHELWNESDPKRYKYEVATMGCRTRVFENLHGEKTSLGRGNLSFTTINLVRLAIEASLETSDVNKRISIFKNKITKLIDIVCEQLKERLEYQKSAKVLQFPFLMYNNIWTGGENKKPNDFVNELLDSGTLGIGFIGGHNAMMAILNEGHGTSDKALNLLKETVTLMNDRIQIIKKQENLNFSLLATPAEGLSGRFVKLDQKKFGILDGITDRDYYINSFHIDVADKISAIEKIKRESIFHELTPAGHITYVEVDGNAKNNVHALLKIIEAMSDNNIGYGSINHPVDQCRSCNYKGIMEVICPICGSEDIRKMRRVTGYLTGDLSTWNNAKKAEEKDRTKHI